MSHNSKRIAKLEAEITRLKQESMRKHGPDFDKYYDMSIEEFRKEYDIINSTYIKIAEIRADREREFKRSRGIDCSCTYTSTCEHCSAYI